MTRCPECEALTGRLRQLCDGSAGIPLARINLYRQQWGFEPLTEETRAAVYLPPACSVPKPRPKLNLYGPGSTLIEMYTEKGVPHCEACYQLACRMDVWGPDECEQRLEEIVADVFPRAKTWIKENKPWMHKLMPAVVEDFAINHKIQSDVQAAIERSRQLIASGTTIKVPAKSSEKKTVTRSTKPVTTQPVKTLKKCCGS